MSNSSGTNYYSLILNIIASLKFYRIRCNNRDKVLTMCLSKNQNTLFFIYYDSNYKMSLSSFIHLTVICKTSTICQELFGVLLQQLTQHRQTPNPMGALRGFSNAREPVVCWSWLKPVHKKKIVKSGICKPVVKHSQSGNIYITGKHCRSGYPPYLTLPCRASC